MRKREDSPHLIHTSRQSSVDEKKCYYETTELKLSALLLSEIPHSELQIYSQNTSHRKTIRIVYQPEHKKKVLELENAFINKAASANVFRYNRALNMIRDGLRENVKNVPNGVFST
jgi:hypothetical protein